MSRSSLRFDRRGFLSASVAGAAVLSSGLPLRAQGRTGRIGFAMETFTVPRWRNLDKPSFETAVRAGGYEPIVVQANFDVAQQLRDIENLLNQGIDALVLVAIDANAAVNMVRRAQRDGVPVIAYNSAIPSSDVAGFVSRDNMNVGRQAVLAAMAAGDISGKWVIASGQAGNAVADEVTAGYYEALKPMIDAGTVEVVSHEFHAGWDPELARKQAENALTANANEIKGFLCNNDGMAGGAIAALEQQGLAGAVFVSGQDATTEACRNIIEGKMTLSSFTRFDVMGAIAGNLAVALANGQAPQAPMTYKSGDAEVPLHPVEDFNVTIENMADYLAQYSPGYVDAAAIVAGLPVDILPEGLEQYR
jgi:ABC-type xylose transport system substrate-binding protein